MFSSQYIKVPEEIFEFYCMFVLLVNTLKKGKMLSIWFY